jgi:hypothetical protein
MGGVPAPALHLDLLHPARQIWRHRLQSVALAELERGVLGIARAGDIPSEEIPRIYFEFLRGAGGEELGAVLRHNRMDLTGLGVLAARILALLGDPEGATEDPVELYGLSRIIQRRGDRERASRLYERSLLRGLPAGAAASARRELALHAKRNGDYDRANLFWGELSESPGDDVRACEELAIHYEHRANDLAGAARLTREAMVRAREAYTSRRIPLLRYQHLHAALQHRLDRITKRLSVDGDRAVQGSAALS